MLTPAEEVGLAGHALAGRVRRAMLRLEGAPLDALLQRIREEADRRGMWYLHEGARESIRVLATPIPVMHEQLRYVHEVTWRLMQACRRLPSLYLADPAVRAVLRLTDGEEAWLHASWSPFHERHNPTFGRLDALADFRAPNWRETLQYLEPNLHGVGGLHLVPSAAEVVATVMAPAIGVVEPELALAPTPDLRALLVEVLLGHLDALGDRGGAIALLEPLDAEDGPNDQEPLARHLREAYGLTVVHADPQQLHCRDGAAWCGDVRVALAYRDYEVLDLVELAAEGVDVSAMRLLFRENRLVSPIGAEIDQKACWEVFTDPVLAERHFTAEERQVFARHVLWTRLLEDRRTTDPAGREVDLLEWVRRDRELLVLKPNRAYGGEGVMVGPAVTQAAWEAALDAALADEDDRWVVQRVATIPVYEFPARDEQGALHEAPYHVVYGFAPTASGVAVLTRASQRQVINVAQRGGLAAVMLGDRPVLAAAV
ncbi:MAG TPA: hypothetical protein VFY20_04075 [Gemmatimonadales bacterium]|nr:hypothetical protein [Gemmatimonadales bacterium]